MLVGRKLALHLSLKDDDRRIWFGIPLKRLSGEIPIRPDVMGIFRTGLLRAGRWKRRWQSNMTSEPFGDWRQNLSKGRITSVQGSTDSALNWWRAIHWHLSDTEEPILLPRLAHLGKLSGTLT